MRAGSAKSLLDSESQFISIRNHQDITNELKKTSSNGPHISSSNYGNTAGNNKNTRYSGTARSRRRDKEKENKEVDNIFQVIYLFSVPVFLLTLTSMNVIDMVV